MECFQTSWLPGSQRASGKGDGETWMGPIAYDFLIALGLCQNWQVQQSRAWDSQPVAGRILGQRPGPQGCRFIRGGRSFGRDWQHGAFDFVREAGQPHQDLPADSHVPEGAGLKYVGDCVKPSPSCSIP